VEELLSMARREHYVRSEQRILNNQIDASTAQTTNQLWTSAATWGTWGAQALMMHYFGMAGRNANRLIQN
jgi:hypothetical protein